MNIDFVSLDQEQPTGYHSAALGWYLHGELENLAGYDIAWCSLNPRHIPDGIYDVTFNGDIKATLYCWKAEYGIHKQLRGLIVKNDDIESVSFAQDKYNSKASNL